MKQFWKYYWKKYVAIFYVCPSASKVTLKDIDGLAQDCSNSIVKALELTVILH